MNQDKFQRNLIRHKKLLAKAFQEDDKPAIAYVSILGKELSLAYANFKCQKCGSEDRLQFHHLIMKYVKDLVDFWRYAGSRYYWGNILVLCEAHHREAHNQNMENVKHKEADLNFWITDKMKDRVRKKYYGN